LEKAARAFAAVVENRRARSGPIVVSSRSGARARTWTSCNPIGAPDSQAWAPRSYCITAEELHIDSEEDAMLVIKTVNGAEIRIPLSELESITEIEPASGDERHPPPHPYLHREGVNRCAACWRPRSDASHTDQAVHS
jgi:hypothetical protein